MKKRHFFIPATNPLHITNADLAKIDLYSVQNKKKALDFHNWQKVSQQAHLPNLYGLIVQREDFLHKICNHIHTILQ